MEAIVYTSHTGFTARYAALLGERTGLPAFPLEQAKRALPRGADVVYLGWLCAGGIKGLKGARRRFAVRAVCAVGMAPEYPKEKLERQNKTENLPLFFIQGGYAPKKLRGVYKLMMGYMTKRVTEKPPKDEAEAEMQQVFLRGGDFVDEANLAPMLAWLREGGR